MRTHHRTLNVSYYVKEANAKKKKEANVKSLHAFDSNYMMFWKRQKYGDSSRPVVVRGQERRK